MSLHWLCPCQSLWHHVDLCIAGNMLCSVACLQNDRSSGKHRGTRANQYRAQMAEIPIRCSHCFYWCQKMLRCLICMFVFMLVLLNQFAAWRMFARQRKTHVPVRRGGRQPLASDTSLNVTVFSDANAAFCPSHCIFVTGTMDLCMRVPGRVKLTRGYLLHRACVCAHAPVRAHTQSGCPPLTKGPFPWGGAGSE